MVLGVVGEMVGLSKMIEGEVKGRWWGGFCGCSFNFFSRHSLRAAPPLIERTR